MQPQISLEGLRVLVVEDEYFLADDLKHILKDCGARSVRLSGNVDDALAQVEADGFELALLDINLHGDFAYSVADELKRQKVPFAFVTGYDRKSVPPRFADVPLWAKPFDPEKLAGNVLKLWKPAAEGQA